MNKSEVVTKLAQSTGITKVYAEIVVDSFFAEIKSALVKGDRVTLTGFGTFVVKKRSARKVRNPKTGATMDVPAKRIVKFFGSSELNEKILWENT